MTNIRNRCLWMLPLLALLPLVAQGEPPAIYNAPIAIDCEHRYISQRDAARVLRTDNFSQTYPKRQSLYANVARLCHGGVEQVLLVTDGRRDGGRTIASRYRPAQVGRTVALPYASRRVPPANSSSPRTAPLFPE